MKLSKVEYKRLTNTYDDLVRGLGQYRGDDWRERFCILENESIDYFVYLNYVYMDLMRIVKIEKDLDMDIKNTYRYKHMLTSDTNNTRSINKIFPSNEYLMADEDVVRSSFIIFMKYEALGWFPDQDEIKWGTYFLNTPMLNGVNDVVVKNFFKITNKTLKKFNKQLMKKREK